MRRNILGLALLAMASTAMAQDANVLKIKGQLAGISDTLLVMRREGGSWHADTAMVKNGKFDAQISLDTPCQIHLITPATMRREEGATPGVTIIGVPGETVELNGDPNVRYDIGGSRFYTEYHEADLMMEEAQKPVIECSKEYSRRIAAGEDANTVGKEMNEKIQPLEKAYQAAILTFIKQHPDYEASAAIIGAIGDPDQMVQAADALSPRVRDGRMKVIYGPILERAKAAKEAEQRAAKVQAAGLEAPDFTLNDINGKPLSLSSLRGKCVVIDFWGSWCGWCIKGMPKMKEYYEKYKGKFEILGVDCNDTEEKWKAAVAKHELPWLHVYNPRGSADDVCAKYAIQGFPTKIIVGADGKIVKNIIGEDPQFYTILDDLLK